MGLLNDVLMASGGLEQWEKLRRFTMHLSIGGTLFTRVRGAALMKDVVAEGQVHEQPLEMTGFTAPDRRASYRPDRVALERSDGKSLAERRATAAEFRGDLKAKAWDELQLVFYCGSLIRAYLGFPFTLADTDVVVRELPPSNGRDERLRRLHARFPERLATHFAEGMFYFDDQSQLRRQEYAPPHADDMIIAQMFSGHQRYSGILVPTLCRLLIKKADGAVITRPSLVDIEIFDVLFL
jgi:hypothetical protein